MNTRTWIVLLDESGVSLLPQIRRTYSPRGRTPLLRHRLNWKRWSMAGALGYHSTDPDRRARLCFHLKPGSYDTAGLIEVPKQVKVFHRGERVVLVWDGLSSPLEPGDASLGRRTGLAHPGTSLKKRELHNGHPPHHRRRTAAARREMAS